MSSETAHLHGVTVLDLSSVGPASRASRMLADYGATVIKVAPTAKKGGVQIRPLYYAYGAGRGMKTVRIDLKAADGKAALLRLAAHADVMIESYRPGVAARLGVGFDDVRALNAGIVYCSTSGYGQDGPYSQWAGHDINYLALGGFLHCSGRDEAGRPAIPGATVADSAAGGMQAVVAIMAALIKRSQTGVGEYLDVSVADGVLQLMSLHIDSYLATGAEVGPGTNVLLGRYAFYDCYKARDGKWLSVGAIEPQFYKNLCTALGCEQWSDSQYEDSVQDDIRDDFRAAFRTRDRDDWVAELGPGNCCVAPVCSIDEVTTDPQFVARRAFSEAEHPEHGRFRQVGPTFAGGDRRQGLHQVRDPNETDTDELLAAAGLGTDEIAALRDAGAVE